MTEGNKKDVKEIGFLRLVPRGKERMMGTDPMISLTRYEGNKSPLMYINRPATKKLGIKEHDKIIIEYTATGDILRIRKANENEIGFKVYKVNKKIEDQLRAVSYTHLTLPTTA